MASIESKSFEQPDETQRFDKTTIEFVGLAEGRVQRTTFHPGWRWSRSVGPAMNADRCSVNHLAYVVSGRLHAEHDDGSVGEVSAGEVLHLAPGHDAWVVGEEPVVLIEFQGLL